MTYRVVLTDKARRFYESASAALQRKLDRCFDVLAQSPREHPNIKPLRGPLKGRYRYRLGDYRVVYRIDDENVLVVVLVIVHRSDAY